jgi:hypothetical protein
LQRKHINDIFVGNISLEFCCQNVNSVVSPYPQAAKPSKKREARELEMGKASEIVV